MKKMFLVIMLGLVLFGCVSAPAVTPTPTASPTPALADARSVIGNAIMHENVSLAYNATYSATYTYNNTTTNANQYEYQNGSKFLSYFAGNASPSTDTQTKSFFVDNVTSICELNSSTQNWTCYALNVTAQFGSYAMRFRTERLALYSNFTDSEKANGEWSKATRDGSIANLSEIVINRTIAGRPCTQINFTRDYTNINESSGSLESYVYCLDNQYGFPLYYKVAFMDGNVSGSFELQASEVNIGAQTPNEMFAVPSERLPIPDGE